MRWLFLLCLLAGCRELIGAENGSECTIDDHCPQHLGCDEVKGRCVEGAREPDPDFGLPDAHRLDAVPDAAESAPDVQRADIGATDAGPPPFPGGACFTEVAGRIPLGSRPSHVPSVHCSEQAVVWTERIDGALRLYWMADGDPQEGPQTTDAASVEVSGKIAVFLAQVEGTGPPVVHELNLETGTSRPLGGGGAHSEPTRIDGVTAYVERGNTSDRHVIVHLDLRRPDLVDTIDCWREGVDQWGPVLGPNWLAFFERPSGTAWSRLVVVDGWDCSAATRVTTPVGSGALSARLVRTNDQLWWLERQPSGLNVLMTASRTAIGGFGPSTLIEGNAIELAGRGEWLAATVFSPARHLMKVRNVVTRRALSLGYHSGNARHPAFSGAFVVWAEQASTAAWELLYERLAQ